MKPGDHPEFFRLPPPPGTSRESTIRIARDGAVFHDGERVDRPALASALLSWVRRHPDDGRFILENGYDWTYVGVDDTGYFVTDVRDEGGEPVLVLSTGREQPLRDTAIAVDDEGACFARVSGTADDARFLRHAQAGLGPYLAEDSPPRIVVGETARPVGDRATRPLPDAATGARQ